MAANLAKRHRSVKLALALLFLFCPIFSAEDPAELLGNVARVNAEVLRRLAMAPAVPANVTVSGGVTPDAKIAWTAQDDPERAGFEILWRETTDPRWSVFDFVSPFGETVLKGVSTDNHFFAVRSVGKNGARSIPVAAVLKPPPPKEPKE